MVQQKQPLKEIIELNLTTNQKGCGVPISRSKFPHDLQPISMPLSMQAECIAVGWLSFYLQAVDPFSGQAGYLHTKHGPDGEVFIPQNGLDSGMKTVSK